MIMFDSSAILNLSPRGAARPSWEVAPWTSRTTSGSAVRRMVYVEKTLSAGDGAAALDVLED